MSVAPIELPKLASIRSKTAEQVIHFLRQLSRHGLQENVRFLPESVPAEEIAAFCLPVRVVDERSYHRSMKDRDRSERHRISEDDPDYLMSSHEALLRSGGHERLTVRPLQHALGGHYRAILCGEPGEGKTTALWLHVARISCEFADRLERREACVDDPDFRIPLALPLGLVPDQKQRNQKTLPALACEHILNCCYATQPPPAAMKWLDRKIRRGEFELCLDALDELVTHENGGSHTSARPSESRREWLRTQLSLYANVPVLLTTRITTDDEDLLSNPVRYRMVCFNQQHADEFVARYFQCEADGHQMATELRQRLRESPGARHVAQLPLLLSILCQLKLRYPLDPLPATRTKLLERCVLAMMERADERRMGNSTRRPARNSEKLNVLFQIAALFYGDEPLPLDEGKLIELLRSLRLRRSGLVGADELLAEFRQDGIVVPTGDRRHRFVLRSFHEFCLAGFVAGQDPAFARERYSRHIFHRDLYCKGWKILAPGWRHVWPLIAGNNPGHTDWLLRAIWPVSEEASAKNTVLAAAELIHEAMNGKDEPPTCALELVEWLNEAACVHPVAVAALGQIGGEMSRHVLATILQQEHVRAHVLASCAAALGVIGSEASRETLVTVLGREQTQNDVRARCVEALGEIGGDESRQVLVAALQKAITYVRDGFDVPGHIATSLGKIGGEASRLALAAVVQQERMPEELRTHCAEALGEIGGDASRRVLEALLQCEQTREDVRQHCAEALGEIGGAAARQVLAAVLQQQQTAVNLRAYCARALGEIGGEASREALVAVLQHEWTPEFLREVCAGALGEIGGDASRQVLTALLQSKLTAEELRKCCAEALGEIGGEASRQVLASVLQRERTPEQLRWACAEALGEFRCEASRRVLLLVLQDERTPERLRKRCAAALGEIGGEASRQVLVELLQQERAPQCVRTSCAAALGEIGGAASWEVLAGILQHEEAPIWLRGACAKAVGTIGGEAAREVLVAVLQQKQASESLRDDLGQSCVNALSRVCGRTVFDRLAFDAIAHTLRANRGPLGLDHECRKCMMWIGIGRQHRALIGRRHPPRMPDPILEVAQSPWGRKLEDYCVQRGC